MLKCRIIRGAPGSGKSTLAIKIANEEGNTIICEADNFFTGREFSPKDLPKAHAYCMERFIDALVFKKNIIVSNTSIAPWEYVNYIRLANIHGYAVSVIDMFGEYKNVHGVPEEKVKDMRKRFQPNRIPVDYNQDQDENE